MKKNIELERKYGKIVNCEKTKLKGDFFMSDKPKKSIFKRWWFWVIAVIIVGAVAAGGSGEDEPKKVSSSKATEANATPEQKEFKIGDTVQLGDNVLTVTKVDKSAGDEFDKPKQGNEYVIVHVRIENKGKDKIDYNPFDFKLQNSNGQLVDAAITGIGNDTALQAGQLTPGGKVEGSITFEAPKGDTKLQLQYTPSFWSDKTIKVNLQ